MSETSKNIVQQQKVLSFRENAKKNHRRKVWVSFGIFDTVSLFLSGYEFISLQSVNRFCYNIAVSRVQCRISNERRIYFVWPSAGSLSKAIVSFSETSGVKLLTQNSLEAAEGPSNSNTPRQAFDFKGWCSIQVGRN